jgi:hypothetical protein
MIDARQEPWPLTTVFSGLQTGADQAALFTAEHLGYATGGWCPRGARTEAGPAPELMRRFGLAEASSDDYGVRTLLNVTHSDGTVVFGRVENTGSALTVRLAMLHKGGARVLLNPTAAYLRRWVVEQGIVTLNVAGNRLSRNPGIWDLVTSTLFDGLRQPGMRADRVPPLVLEPAGRVRR